MGKRGRRRTGPSAIPPAPKKAPGARIARVAVDDATWEAFRAACGSTPASVRLGELVDADVERARASREDASATLREVRARLDELERLLPG